MGTGKPIEFPAAATTRTPEELSAEVLKALRQDIADQLGVAIERAVISVPALFELPQSAATSEAARLAGFERVELLQEPIASALAAGLAGRRRRRRQLAGVRPRRRHVRRLAARDPRRPAPRGRPRRRQLPRRPRLRLGDHRAPRVAARGGAAAQQPRARRRRCARSGWRPRTPRSSCRAASAAQVALAQPLVVDGHDVEVDLELDRATVERLCAPLVDRAIDVCVRLLTSHGLAPGQLGRLVLVGGPTVMPMVRARVAARLETAIAEGHDPMTLVAQGAALYAATAGLDGRAAQLAAPAGRRSGCSTRRCRPTSRRTWSASSSAPTRPPRSSSCAATARGPAPTPRSTPTAPG